MASKTLQSTIEISGVLSPSLQAAIKNAVGKLEEMSKETLESAGAAEKLSAEIGAQESVLKSLQKGYADYIVSGKESSDEAQHLADKIQQLSGELDENKGTLQAAEKAAKQLADKQDDAADASAELGEATEEAGRQAEDASEGYTVLKNVIANLATEAISKAVEAFKELATEGDTALGMLEAKTGATGEKMAGFEDVMCEVYNANYGDSLGDVSEKLSTVIQMTDDLDNASLAKVTKSAIALEDVFGYDVTESMRAVNSLMDKFGITSDQAFNLLVQGAQNGLDQNGDLLDTINEYSVQFKDAGYTADDMFNMLANGTESGTWSVDKLGDAVKEFNIRMSDGTANDYLEQLGVDVDTVMAQFNKGGPEAQKAIGTVMDAIMGCDDATLQYQAGVGLFGTMWEDLGAETVASLMDTEGAISSTSDAMEKMDAAAYDTLESALSQLGRTIKAEVVQPIADKLIPVAKDAVEFVTSKVGPAVDWILAHLPEIGIALGTVGAAVAAIKWADIVAKVTKVIGVIKGMIAAIGAVSAPVWIVIGVVAVLAAAFVNLWKNNEEFRNKITAIWEGIKGKFEAFGQAITDRLNALGFDFESFGEVIKTIWDAICSVLAPIFEGVFQQISNILGGVLDVLVGLFDVFAGIFTGDWDMVWEGVKGIFTGIWDFIVNTFTNVLNMLRGIADTVLGWFGTSWAEVWGSIKDFFVNVWNGITSFFSNALNGIKTTFSNIWNGIVSFLSGAWETIKNVVQVGVQFIGSILSAAFQIITLPFRFIWENCKEYVFAAWEWIKGKVTAAINAVKSVITTVMNAIRSVISTVWDAIKAKVAAVVNAVKSVVSSVWNTIKSVTSSVWNSIKGVISSVWNSIKSAVSAAINAVKSVVSNVWNGIKSVTSSVWNGIKSAVSGAVNAVKSTVSNVFNSVKAKVTSIWNGIKNAILTPIEAAKNKIKGIVDTIKGFFSNMKLNLPKIKLPHFKVEGELSLNPPSVPKLKIDWYKEGGIMTQPTIFGAAGNTLLAGGEAGAEAILPLSVLWDKMDAILTKIFNGTSTTGEPSGEGLTSKAGELLTLDNFSLGSLADGTNVVIYYDFSNFTWSPQIQTGGSGDDEDDLMARLKAHEAEFFDWLEEFIRMREVAQYA